MRVREGQAAAAAGSPVCSTAPTSQPLSATHPHIPQPCTQLVLALCPCPSTCFPHSFFLPATHLGTCEVSPHHHASPECQPIGEPHGSLEVLSVAPQAWCVSGICSTTGSCLITATSVPGAVPGMSNPSTHIRWVRERGKQTHLVSLCTPWTLETIVHHQESRRSGGEGYTGWGVKE